jgi:hypothetical protein
MRGAESPVLSVVVEGTTDESRIAALRNGLEAIQVVEVADGATRDPATLNPLVASAKSNWILLVRAGERVSDALATEIAANAAADPRAWGYRIARRETYCGRVLVLGRRDAGEIRLFHRRRARLQPDGRMKVQGTVVRLDAGVDFVVHESEEAHVTSHRTAGRREVSFVRRLTAFVLSVVRRGPRALSSPARRFLWIEAGWED